MDRVRPKSWPAQSATASASPCAAAAVRIGRFRAFCTGYGSTGTLRSSMSSRNRLRIAQAGRPEKSRSHHAAELAASSRARKAVPIALGVFSEVAGYKPVAPKLLLVPSGVCLVS